MPYDFFMVLEQPGRQELVRSNDNMNNTYRYLPRKATYANPDALPVGFVKDNYRGRDYIGFTCEACHTGQLNYNGVGYRIDGGPAMSDLQNFIGGLTRALNAVDCLLRQTDATLRSERGSYERPRARKLWLGKRDHGRPEKVEPPHHHVLRDQQPHDAFRLCKAGCLRTDLQQDSEYLIDPCLLGKL